MDDDIEAARRASRTPPWGTPRPARAADPAVQARPEQEPAGDPEAEPLASFVVIIQQNSGLGDGKRWTALPWQTFADRESAQVAAEAAARQFAPDHPHSVRERTVVRVTPDEYVVLLRGLSATFHFTVLVGEVLS